MKLKKLAFALSMFASASAFADGPIYVGQNEVPNSVTFGNIIATPFQNNAQIRNQVTYGTIMIGTGAGSIYYGPSHELNNVSVGVASQSSIFGTATGANASALSSRITAASTPEEIALYQGSTTTGVSSFANNGSSSFGRYTSADCLRCGAFGDSTSNKEDDTIAFGGATGQRRLTQVANGINATDAANVSQVQDAKAQAIASSNDYTDKVSVADRAYTDQEISGVRKDVDSLRADIRGIDRKIDASNAMTAAQSNIIFNPYGSQYQVGVGAGYSGSSTAIAVKVMGATADHSKIFSVGLSAGSHGKPSVGGGVTFNWK